MPLLGLIFLRYAYSRFIFVEAYILKNRPVRNGRALPVEADDFKTKSAIFLSAETRYDCSKRRSFAFWTDESK